MIELKKILLFLAFLYSFVSTVYSIEEPFAIDEVYNETSLVLKFEKDKPYVTRFVMYKDRDTPRTDFPNYFDCTLIIGEYRYCVFHSDHPFSRLWGTLYSTVCARDVSSPRVDCTSYRIFMVTYVAPVNVKFSGLPPTSGGDIVINGTFLRFLGGPNELLNNIDFYKPFIVKGNFSDPSFDCNSITVTFPPGCGKFMLFFADSLGGNILFSYAYPIISSISYDSSQQIITINGDNFFTNNSLVQVYFDNILQQSNNITTDHKQIQVNNFNKVDPGPMSIAVVVKDVYVEKNYTHCFPAIITSVSSISSYIGGIVTIKGSKLSSTSNSSLIPTITIGNKQCKFIKSTTSELECQLDPNESGGKKLSVDVNFNGCNSTSSGSSAVTFTYNIPTLPSGSYSNGIVTLIGNNLGKHNESSIQLYANEINIKIERFNISSDEKSLTFKLPHLRCKSFNINFTRNDISLSPLSISSSLLTNVINKPSVSNGTLFIELYYIDCPISSSSTPTITVVNSSSSTNQCSIPSLHSSTSEYYQTTCSIPHGTGMNRQFTFKYNSEVVNNKFSYAPPIINDIINKDNKTLSCGSIITVSGNNLLTNDEEFKVKVLANNQDTTIIKKDENILIVKSDINESPLNVLVFIGNDLILSNVTLTYLEPIITVIPNIKNNKDGISITIGGISLSNIINSSLTLSLNDNDKNNAIIPLTCNLQCSLSPNDTYYYNNTKLSSNEIDITNYTDSLSCHSNSIINETSGVLNIQFTSTSFDYDVKIEKIESSSLSSSSPSSSSPSSSSSLSGGSKSCKLSSSAIAGITIGCVTVVGALVAIF